MKGVVGSLEWFQLSDSKQTDQIPKLKTVARNERR